MSAKIQDKNFWYDALRTIVSFYTLRSYRRCEFVNTGSTPWNTGAVFSINHTNTLMDALVLLSGNSTEKVFMARADIFKKKKIADILTFLKIMPIFRVRDGIRNVAADQKLISDAADILEGDNNFCIFPEGHHTPKHSLQHLGKGISRIAFLASERFGGEKHIKVVPVGIEYEDFFRYRSTFCTEFGEPLDVTDFIQCHADQTSERQHFLFRQLLSEKMKELITYIPDDEFYEGTWEYVKIRTAAVRGTPKERKEARRAVAAEVAELRTKDPERFTGLMEKADRFRDMRHAAKVSVRSALKNCTALRVALKWIPAVVTAPLFALAAVVNAPTVIAVPRITKKLKDKAFANTVRFGGGLVMSTILFIIWTVLLLVFLPWGAALSGIVILSVTRPFYYDWLEWTRIAASDSRWLNDKELQDLYSEIINYKTI